MPRAQNSSNFPRCVIVVHGQVSVRVTCLTPGDCTSTALELKQPRVFSFRQSIHADHTSLVLLYFLSSTKLALMFRAP